MALRRYPLRKVNRLLEPGPILLVTTRHRGKANIMTMGFHTMIQHDPPLIGCVIGPWDYSHRALRETGECCLAVPGVDLARKVVDIGNCSGRTQDKFHDFRLTPLEARAVSAPLVAECLANIECRVADDSLAKQYNLFILEAVAAVTNEDRAERRTLHHKGDGSFAVDGRTLDLRSRMVKWRGLQG